MDTRPRMSDVGDVDVRNVQNKVVPYTQFLYYVAIKAFNSSLGINVEYLIVKGAVKQGT